MTDTASLLLNLTCHDHRVCFAYNTSLNQFIYVNPAFKAFFRVEANNASTKKLFAMVCPEDKTYLKQTYELLKPGVFENNIEFRMTMPDEKEYFLRLNLLLQVSETKEKILTGYIEDISDYKARCQQIHEFADHKKAVLNTISHDLTAPLGSIQNLAALTVRKTKSLEDQEVRKWVLLIEEISKKSVRMVQAFVRKEFTELAGFKIENQNSPCRTKV